mgnify:FL=1
MKKIKSFEVDHTKIFPGIYVSRVDGDIVTYDFRMVTPNSGEYLENDGIHTLEHLLASFLRNSEFEKNIIYVGPMGCRTGFYILVKNMSNAQVLDLLQRACIFIADFEGDIPGATKQECGNYLEHNLSKAKFYARKMCDVIKNIGSEDMHYPL